MCGCTEGNSRNWPSSNPDGLGELGAYWVAAPRAYVRVCKELCCRDSACHGFQWTEVSNQIPEQNMCWFRKDAACEPSPSSVCETRQCELGHDRDCYVKVLADVTVPARSVAPGACVASLDCGLLGKCEGSGADGSTCQCFAGSVFRVIQFSLEQSFSDDIVAQPFFASHLKPQSPHVFEQMLETGMPAMLDLQPCVATRNAQEMSMAEQSVPPL